MKFKEFTELNENSENQETEIKEADMKYQALAMAKELHNQLASLTFIEMLGVMSPDNPAKKEVQELETKINDLTTEVGDFIQKYIPDVSDAEAGDISDIEDDEEDVKEPPKPIKKAEKKPKKEKVEEGYGVRSSTFKRQNYKMKSKRQEADMKIDDVPRAKLLKFVGADLDYIDNKDGSVSFHNKNHYEKALEIMNENSGKISFSDHVTESNIDKEVEASMMKALKNKMNFDRNGSVNWNYIDADVYMDVNKKKKYNDTDFYKSFDRVRSKLVKEWRKGNLRLISECTDMETINENPWKKMKLSAGKKLYKKEYEMALTLMEKYNMSASEAARQFGHVDIRELQKMAKELGVQ